MMVLQPAKGGVGASFSTPAFSFQLGGDADARSPEAVPVEPGTGVLGIAKSIVPTFSDQGKRKSLVV